MEGVELLDVGGGGLLGGADGVLVVNRPVREGATAQMRVINADGSEASMCGNGLRTVARYVAERDNLEDFKVDTMDASLRVRKQPDLASGVPAFAVEISPVRFNKEALPYDHLGHDRLLNTLVPELLPGSLCLQRHFCRYRRTGGLCRAGPAFVYPFEKGVRPSGVSHQTKGVNRSIRRGMYQNTESTERNRSHESQFWRKACRTH